MTDAKLAPPLLARLARRAGPLKRVRGYSRLLEAMCPKEAGARFAFDSDFFGLRYRGNLGSHIDRQVYFFGAYEADELAFVRRWWGGRTGGVALDVGANVGHHTLAFSRIFGTVLAFEPNPEVFKELESAVRLNHIENARLHAFGLWDRDEILMFNVPPEDNTGMGSFKDEIPGMEGVAKLTLPVRCGDGVLEAAGVETIDFVKIDVQGAECEALDGLAQILEKSRPLIWVEISATTRETLPTLASLRAKLGGQSFDAFYLKRTNPLITVRAMHPADETIYKTLDDNLFLVPAQAS